MINQRDLIDELASLDRQEIEQQKVLAKIEGARDMVRHLLAKGEKAAQAARIQARGQTEHPAEANGRTAELTAN